MKFHGALVKAQGIIFGIIIVKPWVLNNGASSNKCRTFGRKVFGPIPLILMAPDSHGVPTYSGRRDIVRFLVRLPIQAIPWRECTLN